MPQAGARMIKVLQGATGYPVSRLHVSNLAGTSLNSSDIRGKSPAEFIEPRRGEVQVWRAFLDVLPSYLESLCPILSVTERERAARFHFERDRSRFVVTRALLRILVERYLQQNRAKYSSAMAETASPSWPTGKSSSSFQSIPF